MQKYVYFKQDIRWTLNMFVNVMPSICKTGAYVYCMNEN